MTQNQMLAGITRLFVARPIFAFVINLLIIIAGISAFMGVEVREMPDIDQPSISINTDYEGASANIVDRNVTSVLEDAFGTLNGVKAISSTSSYAKSRITIDLSHDTDINVAANDAREIISHTLGKLPEDAAEPTVRKSDAEAEPIIRMSLSGGKNLQELTLLAENRIKDRLSLIDGIAEINVTGAQASEFRISVSLPDLLVRGLTLHDVDTALQTLRNDYALGTVDSDVSSTILRALSPAVTAELIGDLRINETTRVSDIAFVQLTAKEKKSFARSNSETSVGIDVVRQSIGNTLTVSQAVRTAVEELQIQLPDGVQLVMNTDDGLFIQNSILEVTKSILLAVGIVVVVIFLFLRSWRATLIPVVAIPVALIGTLAAIWLAGFSINTISLLAWVLATGLVVDDSIVVVENIVRHRQNGEGSRLAAVTGSNEVFFAVISTTATLAAVFVPISFLPGQAGAVFSEFGFVLAFCVTISTVVAFTMGPMLASILDPGKLSTAQVETKQSEKKDGLFMRLFFYVIDYSIRLPLLTIGIALALAVFALGGAKNLQSTLTPPEDRGVLFIRAIAPTGSTNSYLSEQVEKIEAILKPYRDSGEIFSVLSLVGRGGSSSAAVIVRLADWKDRQRNRVVIQEELTPKLAHVSGVRLMVRSPNSLGIRGGGSGLSFAVTGADYDKLTGATDDLIAAMEGDATFNNPQLDSDNTTPQVSVDFDLDRALELGIVPATIADTISMVTEGLIATTVFVDGEEINLRLTPDGMPINDTNSLESVFARTNQGNIIPLSSVASFSQELAQSTYARENGALAIAVDSDLPMGVTLGESVERIMQIAKEVLPEQTSITLLGDAAELEASAYATLMVFAIAGLIVLLVLAAQFESFTSAIIIMLTVPFGLAAAMLAITITGGTLNYYSQIGLVMLIGIMAKNGILIVEFANKLRERGQDLDSAIREAVRLRIRPVMMTMLSTVFGGVPLILTSGAGAEARIAVGWVIVGGLGFATVFTLFLIPTFYRWISPIGQRPGIAKQKLMADVSHI